MTTSDRPDLEQLTDLCTPWCVHTVATLRIAEHMAAGTTTVADLAAAAGCDPRALGSVLRHLVGKGLFEQPEPGHFILNDLSSQLLHAGPFLDLSGIAGRMAYAWGTLPTYVRTGRPGYQEVFGLPSLGIDMVVAGGITSSLTEFRELSRQAGLAVTATEEHPAGRGLVVECQPTGG